MNGAGAPPASRPGGAASAFQGLPENPRSPRAEAHAGPAGRRLLPGSGSASPFHRVARGHRPHAPCAQQPRPPLLGRTDVLLSL